MSNIIEQMEATSVLARAAAQGGWTLNDAQHLIVLIENQPDGHLVIDRMRERWFRVQNSVIAKAEAAEAARQSARREAP